jgi:hypothetical protein
MGRMARTKSPAATIILFFRPSLAVDDTSFPALATILPVAIPFTGPFSATGVFPSIMKSPWKNQRFEKKSVF